MKNNGMDGHVARMVVSEYLKRRDPLPYLGVGERRILKRILKK